MKTQLLRKSTAIKMLGLLTFIILTACKTLSLPEAIVLKKSNFVKITENTFLSKHEVSNIEYRIFLNSISDKNSELFNKCQVDSMNWNQFDFFPKDTDRNKPGAYARNYFQLYDDFPVVNINFFGAKEYCKWLTKKLNGNQAKKILIRLPRLDEFSKAKSLVEHKIMSDNISDYGDHPNINLKYLSGDHIDYVSDGGFHTSRVKFGSWNGVKRKKEDYYYTTASGIIHLYGNVSEFLAEEYAIGGNFRSFPSEVMNAILLEETPSPLVGFRVVKEIR